MKRENELVKPDKILKAAGVGIWKWDLKTNKVTWSPILEKIHGLRKGQFGGNFEDFKKDIHPEDKKRVLSQIKNALEKRKKYSTAYRIVLPNGRIRWLSAKGVVLMGKNGKPFAMTGICTDITNRKLAEQEKEDSKRQLEAVFKSVPEGITVERKNGEIVFANDSSAKLFGFKANSGLIGKNIEEVLAKFFISDTKGKTYKVSDLPGAKVFEGKKKAEVKLSFLNLKTGVENWFYIKATPIINKEKGAYLVVKSFQDVTKLVEEQKEKELFLGLVGHELRSPLASIKAFSQLLRRKVKNDRSLDDYLNNLDRQSNRLISLVNNILDATKIRAGLFGLNKKKFHFDKLVDEVVVNFQLTVKNKIQVNGKTDVYFYGDEDRIAQVLNNLLTNACRYSKENQKIIITRALVAGKLRIDVRDFGVGISKENQKMIFKLYKRFQSANGIGQEGLGMGLFIASAIIQAHRGNLTVKSKVGSGSTFTFFLPLSLKKRKKTISKSLSSGEVFKYFNVN